MTAEEYLRERLQILSGVLERNPDTKQRINKGLKSLADSSVWRLRLTDWVGQSLETLMSMSRVAIADNKKVKLTNLSSKIGIAIAHEIGLDDNDPQITIPIGDVFVEAFIEEGICEVERESKLREAPYVVHVKDIEYKKAPLKGTLFHPPGDIRGIKGVNGYYIKRFTGEDSDYFRGIIEDNPCFLQSLNKLRNTPWRLNLALLEVICSNPQEDSIKLKNRRDHREVWFEFGEVPTNKDWVHPDGSKFEGTKDVILLKAKSKLYDYNATVAKALTINDRVFYQEHTCDYRGRVYSSEAYMQFQGSDIARGIMEFAERKPYSASGIRRLKVHLANSYNKSFHKDAIPDYMEGKYAKYLEEQGLDTVSMDKLLLNDRIAWVDANIPWICSRTDLDPDAENPVAFLAACWELDKVIHIEGYEGGLPIPVDGSNNGWQHLSAMSKDPDAASLVSMTNEKYQKDFYVAVAKEMIKSAKPWFKKKNIPMKHIRKGIAKRGAMTRAYSAGKEKIAINMLADCKQMGLASTYRISDDDCHMLAGHLIDAVNTVCKGPLRLTKWLQSVAKHEIEMGETEFQWTTPSGFPVRYKMLVKGETKVWSTIKQIGQIGHIIVSPKTRMIKNEENIWEDTGELIADARAYASGIAPNVVHSYDAAHMSFVITRFDGCFGAVHDSFSTHASDVDDLLDITKGTFIGMYAMDSWFDDFKDRIMKHKDTFTLPNPELGSYNVESVLDADYFFC